MYYRKIFSLAVLLAALMGCDDSGRKKTTNKKQTKALAELKLMADGRAVELKPALGVPQHTNLVGDIEHPTIDGGIINAADGIPINNPTEKLAKNDNQKIETSAVGNNKPFNDNWATSEKVKKMLQEAATEGKLNYVLKQTEEKGLPASVATIPMIESNYKNNAASPKGAAGAWQLMPQTAQDSGLSLDERQQFVPSTDTAINLLAQLHEKFGSWELAFAAYNAGPERVKTALQKNPKAQRINDLDLPQETKDYVAKIMAINQAIEKIDLNKN